VSFGIFCSLITVIIEDIEKMSITMFLRISIVRIGVIYMMKFKNNKLELFKELRKLVTENLNNANVNVDLEYEVAELLTEITDKRKLRRLKLVRKELDKLIEQLSEKEVKND